ncbi:MAG: hypothetical protein HRU28_09450 [Rhizobiales bacterium]|nr:hypothetical protein [Hyphomicrobiales bacterium]
MPNPALKGLTRRHPGGRKKQSKKIKKVDEDKFAPSNIYQRIQYIADKHVKKQEAGNLLGCLFLDGLLEHRQFEASKKIALHMARYSIITGMPKPTVQAIDLNQISGYSDFEPDEEKILKAKEHYFNIEQICDTLAGQQSLCSPYLFKAKSLTILREILIYDQIPARDWKKFSWSLKYRFVNYLLNEFADHYKLKNP